MEYMLPLKAHNFVSFIETAFVSVSALFSAIWLKAVMLRLGPALLLAFLHCFHLFLVKRLHLLINRIIE